MPVDEWTNHEVAYLRSNYGFVTVKQLSHSMGRPENGIRKKACELGLRSVLPRRSGQKATDDQIKQLIYEGYSAREIAEKFDMSKRSVNLRLQNDAFDDMDRAAIKKNGKEWWKKKPPHPLQYTGEG